MFYINNNEVNFFLYLFYFSLKLNVYKYIQSKVIIIYFTLKTQFKLTRYKDFFL